ncbi:hypothetical protein [Murinocardiopsis flavida]|uniref:hypothetical protein n=1 Tax=Murinocardiopsis flavida TaxID=645275 RepID=UPI0011B2837C|nr:hypothetical protein [Murinocardiopsis flavida]
MSSPVGRSDAVAQILALSGTVLAVCWTLAAAAASYSGASPLVPAVFSLLISHVVFAMPLVLLCALKRDLEDEIVYVAACSCVPGLGFGFLLTLAADPQWWQNGVVNLLLLTFIFGVPACLAGVPLTLLAVLPRWPRWWLRTSSLAPLLPGAVIVAGVAAS